MHQQAVSLLFRAQKRFANENHPAADK